MTKTSLLSGNIGPMVDATVIFGGIAAATRLAGVR